MSEVHCLFEFYTVYSDRKLANYFLRKLIFYCCHCQSEVAYAVTCKVEKVVKWEARVSRVVRAEQFCCVSCRRSVLGVWSGVYDKPRQTLRILSATFTTAVVHVRSCPTRCHKVAARFTAKQTYLQIIWSVPVCICKVLCIVHEKD